MVTENHYELIVELFKRRGSIDVISLLDYYAPLSYSLLLKVFAEVSNIQLFYRAKGLLATRGIIDVHWGGDGEQIVSLTRVGRELACSIRLLGRWEGVDWVAANSILVPNHTLEEDADDE